MPKLTRYLQKLFAGNSNQIGVFGSGINKQTSTNVETLQSADYDDGWSAAIVTNKNYPIWQEMDGVQYGFSYQLKYLFQNGIPEWLNTETYYTNSYCRVGSDIYYSLQDDNTGHNPALNDGYWKLYNGDNLFKNQTSNCILEMPSTSPSYSSLTVTIPAGLKVLIPNGRNADGTCKNIEYTTTSALTYTITQPTYATSWFLFLTSSGTLTALARFNVGTSNYGIEYFDYVKNCWRYNNSGTWQDLSQCLIGEIANSSTAITSLQLYNGTRLLNFEDKHNIISWNFPVLYGQSMTFSYTSGTKYYAPQNGYFVAGCTINSVGASFNIYIGDNIPWMNSRAGGNNVCVVSAPCRSGDYVTLSWATAPVSGSGYVYFVPTQGTQSTL